MKVINIDEIVVPDSLLNSLPKQKKIDYVRNYYEQHNNLDKPVVIQNGILVDNYIRYLVAKEVGMTEIPYLTKEEYQETFACDKSVVTYITGKFEHCKKEYTWKVTRDIHFEIGDKALVKSGKKVAIVTVAKVFTSDNPALLRHKVVLKKIKYNKGCAYGSGS